MIELADLEKYDITGVYERLRSACNVDSDMSLVELICSTSYLNGEPFSFLGYEYLIQPTEDLHPWQVIIKPAQKGASETFARKMFAILYRFGRMPHYYTENGTERVIWGISGIYSFPDSDSLQKFSKDRILTDIIKSSPLYEAAMKQSDSEAATQIGIFNSYCYMLGRKSDTSNQSVPAEVIMVDESDRPLNGDQRIRAQLYGRTRNARIFGNAHYKGLTIEYGTPTLPDEEGHLLDGKYLLSDQHEWQIKCTRCNHWQTIIYPDSIKNYYEPGKPKGKKDPEWMCLKCHRPIDWTEIGKWNRREPLKTHNCQWVAKYPERTKDGGGTRGYRIPFATPRDTAKQLLIERDTKWKNSPSDFHNLGLGLAHRDASIGLSEEDFTACRVDDCHWGVYDSGTSYIMGLDQGLYLVVAGLKYGSQTDINPIGIWQIVWCEHIPETVGFSKVVRNHKGDLEIQKGELARRIEQWNPEVIVMDHLPNTASAEAEADIYRETMWLNDSKGNTGMQRVRFDETDSDGNIIHRITEQKHLAIEETFQQIRGQKWQMPLIDNEQFKLFRAHLKNIKKVVDPEKGTFVYESFGPDHFGQAMKLCSEAAELFSVVRPRGKRANILIVTGFQSRRES
jgi:hypothetical protein